MRLSNSPPVALVALHSVDDRGQLAQHDRATSTSCSMYGSLSPRALQTRSCMGDKAADQSAWPHHSPERSAVLASRLAFADCSVRGAK